MSATYFGRRFLLILLLLLLLIRMLLLLLLLPALCSVCGLFLQPRLTPDCLCPPRCCPYPQNKKCRADTETTAEAEIAATAHTPLRTQKTPSKAVIPSDDADRHDGLVKRRTTTTKTKTPNALDKGCGAGSAEGHLKHGDFPKNETNHNNHKNDDDDPLDNSDNHYDSDDEEYVQLVITNRLKDHEIERRVGDCNRAVRIRRKALARRYPNLETSLDALPHRNYDFAQVHGANCEIVVGYLPLPVGLAGPLTVNGESYHIPMATTEGCLVASTNRGCKALNAGGGVSAVVTADAITRAPCLRLPTATRAAALKLWCHEPDNFVALKQAFESTTSFGKLLQCQATVAGRNVYLRLSCFAGDAMGMNMVSKGSLAVVEHLAHHFPDLTLVALSGNVCTDKKAAATNWIHGRGKSVVAESIIPASIVKSVLKTTVPAIVDTNLQKNLVGSAMAGTLGGFNAHASNIVTALFLATGQDPAQNVESSNCITLLEETPEGDLWISCTMPSLEVGTVGGGTSLPAQAACLDALGCRGSGSPPGRNAQTLATIVASAVVAGELSLLAALAANTLVQAHLQHNRKPATTSTATTKEA